MKENKKKTYERPLLQVFALQQTANLLTLSGPGSYENGGDPLSGSPAQSFDDEEILFE